MFSLGWGEIVVIGLLALLVLGPKRLPEVARQIGKAWGTLRRTFMESTKDLREELREVNKEMNQASQRIYQEMTPPATPTSSSQPPAPQDDAEVTADADLGDFIGEVTGKADDGKDKGGT